MAFEASLELLRLALVADARLGRQILLDDPLQRVEPLARSIRPARGADWIVIERRRSKRFRVCGAADLGQRHEGRERNEIAVRRAHEGVGQIARRRPVLRRGRG